MCVNSPVGKTTLLRVLIHRGAGGRAAVTIEDSLGRGNDRFGALHPGVVALEARQSNIKGRGGIELEQLVRMGGDGATTGPMIGSPETA